MLYSRWNAGAQAYDYFEASGNHAATNEIKPGHLRATTPLGMPAPSAGWPLPRGAKRVGRGKRPKGRIASQLSGVDGFLSNPSKPEMLLLLAAGFLAWQAMR